MGCGPSKPETDDKEAVQQNAKIDRMLRQDKKVEARTVKILLLGASMPYHVLAHNSICKEHSY